MIAEASVALGRAVDLPRGELDRIRTASLLHDLGKLAIPEDILGRPGDLAISEWRVVTEHPKIGQVVLEQAGALRDAATIVLHHHEWYDGRGYPHGLTGGDIPIGARIVSIVDAYEAMIAGRPYRAAISHEAAIDELRRQAGVQFDPDLVEVFAALYCGRAAVGHRRPSSSGRATRTITISTSLPRRPSPSGPGAARGAVAGRPRSARSGAGDAPPRSSTTRSTTGGVGRAEPAAIATAVWAIRLPAARRRAAPTSVRTASG